MDPEIAKGKDGKLFKVDSWGIIYPVDKAGTRLTAKTDRPESIPGNIWQTTKPRPKAKAIADYKSKTSREVKDTKTEPATPATPRGAGGSTVVNMTIGLKQLLVRSTEACPAKMADTSTAEGRFDSGGFTDAETTNPGEDGSSDDDKDWCEFFED